MSTTFDVENTPLHIAAHKTNNSTSIRSLIRQGADLEATNKAGWTPLHIAVAENSYGKAKALLEAGANVNATIDRQEDDTALHLTAWTNNAKMARLLIAHGARLDMYGEMGTPLETANHFRAYRVASVIQKEIHKREQAYLTQIENRHALRRIVAYKRCFKHYAPVRTRV
ncbi:MAG: ankyrin repeat domain-containing protein [Alphaproteobacteria bacterium]|nr:ankyrin repeat domain-containing protein [Alphaproteobacteria bacterium]